MTIVQRVERIYNKSCIALQLAQAYKDGRVVVLPCKVGDTIWFNTYAKNATVCLGVQPHKVSRYEISAVVGGEYVDTEIPLYEFGRTVFLSREEAEAAMKGDNHA